MHWTWWITYLLIMPWLLAGAFVSRTAMVLFAAWLLGELSWYATGVQVPVPLYVLTDAVSMIAISRWATGRDWWILALYPLAWPAYAWPPHALQWWWLLIIFWAQAIIAGPWQAFARNRTREGRRTGLRWLPR